MSKTNKLLNLIKHPLFLLIILYLIFRIPFLTKLPIFNDESIYLDWAWRMTHNPGMLYYSLYDAKQPLLMWFFGISQNIFNDPLFAGRIISVSTGFVTMIGIYKIAKYMSTVKVAVFSSLLYIVVPVFVFFDRQALMESAVACCGVWACYLSLLCWKSEKNKYFIYLGLILGIGFLIKTSALLFFFAFLGISMYLLVKSKEKNKELKKIGLTLLIFLLTIILLLLNPMYWKTLGTNSRYVLTIPEIIRFPIGTWLSTITGNAEILFIFVTPYVAIFSIIGMYLLHKEKGKLLMFWIVLLLIFETVSVKESTLRYIAPYLPLLVIPTAYFIERIKNKQWKKLTFLLTYSIPTILTIILIVNPILAISTFSKITRFADSGYIKGQNSGITAIQAVRYLEEISEKKPIIVTYAENTGNPESTVLVYLQKKGITTAYFDGTKFGNITDEVECLDIPAKEAIYFVSRQDQQAGLNKFLTKQTEFKDESGYSTGIYLLNRDCSGKKAIPLDFGIVN